MAHGAARITINRSISKVFAFVADARNATRWQPGLVAVKLAPDDTTRVGTLVTQQRVYGRRQLVTTAQIVDLRLNELLHERISGGPIADVVTTFRAVAMGTEVTSQLTLARTGVLAVFGPFLAPFLRWDAANGLRNLKRVLERDEQTERH